MRAAILDDEFDARDLLISMLKEIGGVNISGSYEHPHDAISGVLMTRPDIIFMDIKMPALNGFEVLDALMGRDYYPHIIFVTAHNQFAIKAIKYAAFDYLLKPITREELSETINRLRTRPQNDISAQIQKLTDYLQPSNRLKINTRTGYILINAKDIVYCKADGNYTDIFLTNGKKEVASMNLGKSYSHLQVNTSFKRLGRSLVINEDYIFKIDRSEKAIHLQANDQSFKVLVPLQYLSQFIID